MDAQVKRKVMAKVELGRPRAQVTLTRPVSPLKAPSVASSLSASPATSPTVSRPRAQVSGSAKTNITRKPIVQQAAAANNKPTRSGALTPRSQSPTKQLEAVRATANGRLSPALSSVSRLRSKTSASAVSASLPPSSPRLPHIPTASTSAAPIPATTSDPILSSTPIRIRHASVSSMSEILATSPQNHLLSPPSSSLSNTHDSDTPASSPMRVKAKVTSIARAKPSTPTTPSFSSVSPPQQQQLPSPTPSITSSPNLPGTRRIGRTSSVSSLSAFDPIYPITVSHPLGNPHRFSTQRAASPFRRQPLPFSSPTNSPDKENANPDPASVPLPPLSPPSSTLSFSSHSSTSRSSLSSTSHTTAPGIQFSVIETNGSSALESGWSNHTARGRALSVASCDPTYERRSQGDPGAVADGGMEDERKQKAEAKSNRKIADLEITNSSLLAINASLEASKHKQAKEIRELRKKLRETRLVLPPRVYREMRDNHGSDSFYADEQIDEDEDDEDEDESDVDDADDEANLGADDATYMRVRALVSGLLESGRQALESKPEDFEPSPKGVKVTRVLHEVEARTWRAETYDKDSMNTAIDRDDTESSGHSSDEDNITFDTHGNGSSRSEDEVEEVEEMVGNETKGSI